MPMGVAALDKPRKLLDRYKLNKSSHSLLVLPNKKLIGFFIIFAINRLIPPLFSLKI